MGEQKSLDDQKWTILLESSKKFVALAKFRKQESDFMQAISVLNETLLYVNPNAFKGSPYHILKQTLDLNIQIYLELADTFIQLKKYEAAQGCLRQVFLNDGENVTAKQLAQKIEQQLQKVQNKDQLIKPKSIDAHSC